MIFNLSCEICGEKIFISESRYNKNKTKKFACSKECSAKLKIKEPNTECPVCGKKFRAKGSYLRRLKNLPCCSLACSVVRRKDLLKGEKNHQYGLKGELNSTFKSDIRLSYHGYVLVRCLNHPFKNCDDMIFLHRLLFEEFLREVEPDSEYLIEVEGYKEKFLSPDCAIHHKDHNKLNNSIENLDILTLGDHVSLHNFCRDMERDEYGRFVSTSGKKIKKSNKNLIKKYLYDAGLDIVSNSNYIIKPQDKCLIDTDLFIEVPKNHVGLIWSRSGLSVKYGIHVGAGCIDHGYTGEVKVLLYNFGKNDFEIKKGDKIAQLLTLPINIFPYEEVDKLKEADRADNGFGSTDKHVA